MLTESGAYVIQPGGTPSVYRAYLFQQDGTPVYIDGSYVFKQAGRTSAY